MNIALYGFMASGKTSLGRALAKALNYTFFDLDTEIELIRAASISEIFQEKGELFFRKLEHEVLKDFIKKDKKNVVLSLGGGAIINPSNRKLLEIRSYTKVYLNVQPEQLIQRLKKDFQNRPLLKNIKPEEFDEYIKALFEIRKPVYEKYADIKVDINNEDFNTALKKLYLHLNLN